MSNEYEETLATQVKAAIYDHFMDHSGEVITPEEWNAAVVAIVLKLQGATPTKAVLDDLALAEAKVEDRELFYQEELRKAEDKGRVKAIKEAIVSLKSFCDSEPRLGPDDKKDISGVLRAVNILAKELV